MNSKTVVQSYRELCCVVVYHIKKIQLVHNAKNWPDRNTFCWFRPDELQEDWRTSGCTFQPQLCYNSKVCEIFWRINFVPENFMPRLVYASLCYSNTVQRISVLMIGMAWIQKWRNEINVFLGTLPYQQKCHFMLSLYPSHTWSPVCISDISHHKITFKSQMRAIFFFFLPG